MKFDNKKLRKVSVVMDCVMTAIFGAGMIMSLAQDEYWVTPFFLLLVLAWAVVLAKDLEIGHYIKLVDLYKELERKQDEYINILIGVINEKQTRQ